MFSRSPLLKLVVTAVAGACVLHSLSAEVAPLHDAVVNALYTRAKHVHPALDKQRERVLTSLSSACMKSFKHMPDSERISAANDANRYVTSRGGIIPALPILWRDKVEQQLTEAALCIIVFPQYAHDYDFELFSGIQSSESGGNGGA